MRALFASAPLHAHLDWGGYLATAAALQARGHEATWVSGPALEDAVRAAGIDFVSIEETGWLWPPPPPLARPRDLGDADYAQQRALRSFDQWLDPDRAARAVEALRPVIERHQPDLIAGEIFSAAAALCAEEAGVPFAVCGWPAHALAPPLAAFAPIAQIARNRLDAILDRLSLSGANFSHSGPPVVLSPSLHLTYWCESWFAGARFLPQTRHCGGHASPPLPPPDAFPSPHDRPWVWITLGTNFVDDPDFFRMATRAAHDLGCLPIVSTGRRDADLVWRADAPPETIVTERIDFTSVLPWTAAVIHHGGAGTTHALALHAVPQVVVPHAGDQARQASGIQRTGAGIAMTPGETSATRLREALAALLPDRSDQRAAAVRLRDELASLGGPPRAAVLLEGLGHNPQG